MADFRRPPEWDQHADRHSELTDPVLTVRQMSRFEYRKPLTRIDNALVFTTGKGGYEVYLPPHRPSRGDLAAKRYTAVYEVDMGIHRAQTTMDLPSDNDAFDFTASVGMTWQVVRPDLFVASGERDVPALLARRLEELMRPAGRGVPADSASTAERRVRAAVDAAGPLGGEAGLRVDWTVRLRLDDEEIAHQRELRAIRHAGQKLSPAHELALREARLRADRDLEQSRQQHELAVLQGQQQIELQRIEAQKIAFYQYHLQQGGVAAWAFHLSQHPEDSRLVMESLRQDQLALIKSQTEVALRVLRGDGVEEYELEEPKKQALELVTALLTEGLPGATQAPPVQGPLPWEQPPPAAGPPQDATPGDPPGTA